MSQHRYGNLTALARERCSSQLNKSGLVHQSIARRTLPEKSSQIADFSRKRVTHKPHLQDEELWKKYELAAKDGNDAATNTPILFTTNWDADDSGTMSDEADTNNDGDMGNDMDDFHDGANGADELMGNENLESEESQDSHGFAGSSKTSKHNNATELVDENLENEEVHGNHGLTATSKTRPQTGEKCRVRGKNKCKEVADLMESQKIKVQFYNNRALSKSFARHLGRIVRNPRITPMRVNEWSNITDAARKHIFDAIKDKFENIDDNIAIDVYKDEILDHVKKLWINWRGDLHRHFVKPKKTMQEAMKKVPKDIPKDDWEWLVKEHFFSKEFLKKSKRNTQNRANLKMLHRSGSKPFRQIIWDMGGKENKPPSMDKLFSETHKKGTDFPDSTTSAKHAQIKTIFS
uniref:Uncharacterized protein n=1 Tax=Triticum urartu TaxID=4572 RepID=A0A8R7P3A9_TRIUA